MDQPLVLQPVTVSMLFTTDLHPLPDDVVVDQHLGMETLTLSNDEVVEGQHMVLSFETTLDFINWVDERPFWLFDSREEKFEYVLIKGRH